MLTIEAGAVMQQQDAAPMHAILQSSHVDTESEAALC